MVTITAVKFTNYKTFKKFSVSLTDFNIIVGPNNAGKSTVIGALKLLSEGIKKANAKKPNPIRDIDDKLVFGYELDLSQAPIATENVFYNYDDTTPAIIRFTLSNNAFITIFFPSVGSCLMYVESEEFAIRSPKDFKQYVSINIGFVPILSPVENHEQLFQKEAARLAISSPKASRNFRNIWFHYGDDFDEFKELINSTWPGMDIQRPEPDFTQTPTVLNMFCPEDRILREIFWAGYGFQIWCQMLTYIIKNKDATLFIIDEPDIYLHSDLQRQLLGILKELGPAIVIATHSTEIITEADLSDILIINKTFASARRIKDPSQLRELFKVLGSSLNPVLTQIAKTKRVLFVEGKDFAILSKLARILGFKDVANRTHFAVVPVEGFNPAKLRSFKEGIEKTMGYPIVSAVIFDRDYRSDNEVIHELNDLNRGNFFAHIHSFKELENILLIPAAIQKAIEKKIKNSNERTGDCKTFDIGMNELLTTLTDEFKSNIFGQLSSHQLKFERSNNKGVDDSSMLQQINRTFDDKWKSLDDRLKMVPGKEFITAINKYLQENYQISLTHSNIVDQISKQMLSTEIVALMTQLNELRRQHSNDEDT
ncbi:ATP-dependent nuclease [Mucilaginibacter defluvii]|uniref:ATPase AAA-type core domain-containing protein n=1 Tax=Mucilaginibacter defluvii TaxID=1196019 RepID=A0ABP9G1Q6_9SPHI